MRLRGSALPFLDYSVNFTPPDPNDNGGQAFCGLHTDRALHAEMALHHDYSIIQGAIV